jgi:hypothetical protein
VSRNGLRLVEACPIFGHASRATGLRAQRRAHERAASPELAMREVVWRGSIATAMMSARRTHVAPGPGASWGRSTGESVERPAEDTFCIFISHKHDDPHWPWRYAMRCTGSATAVSSASVGSRHRGQRGLGRQIH